MGSDLLVKTFKVNNVECKIFVSPSGEFFWLDEDRESLRAPTLKELESKITRHTKRTLKIPVVCWRGETRWSNQKVLKRGVITGVHAGNNNLLVRWGGEKGVEQEGSYSSEPLLRVSMAEEVEYVKMKTDLQKLEEKIEKFEKEHVIDRHKILNSEDE